MGDVIVATALSAITVAWFAAMRAMVTSVLTEFTYTYSNIMLNISYILLPTITAMVSFEGYKIALGQSTEPAGTYMLKWGKIILLSTTATYAGADSESLNNIITQGIEAVSTVLTGHADVFKVIDSELLPAVALSMIASSLSSNTGGEDDIGRLVTMVAGNLGALLPIVTALVTSYSLEITLKIGTILSPIFIFAGIFERTADWPFTWAKFMFGIILTSGLMALMGKACLAVSAVTSVTAVAAYFTGTSALFLTMLSAIEGLFLSVLLISLPGVAMKLLGMAAEGAISNQLGSGNADKDKDSYDGNNTKTRYGNRNVLPPPAPPAPRPPTK
jgi:TrbL/VirB6 plasmid conjugal transfer protein